MNIIPLYDRIFVLPDEVVDRTKGGIILTDYTKKRPTSGTVIAVGKGATIECPKCKHLVIKPTQIKVGMRILYGEFSGIRQVISYKGKDVEIFIMTEDDISALLK
jgi:co-chaperonin GroES (HSP10)